MNSLNIYSDFISQKSIYYILGIIGIISIIISFIFLFIIKYSYYKGFGIASFIYGLLIIVQSVFNIKTLSLIASNYTTTYNNKVWKDGVIQIVKNEVTTLFQFELVAFFLMILHIIFFLVKNNKLFWKGYALSTILITALTLIFYVLLHINYILIINQLSV